MPVWPIRSVISIFAWNDELISGICGIFVVWILKIFQVQHISSPKKMSGPIWAVEIFILKTPTVETRAVYFNSFQLFIFFNLSPNDRPHLDSGAVDIDSWPFILDSTDKKFLTLQGASSGVLKISSGILFTRKLKISLTNRLPSSNITSNLNQPIRCHHFNQ